MIIDKNLNNGRDAIRELTSKAEFSNKPKIIVDISAGEGKDLQNLIKLKMHEIHAVENYTPFVQKLKANGVNTHYTDIESESLPLEDCSVDLIIANQVLEHCNEVFWIFSEICRVLKRNGKLIFGVPNLASLYNKILLSFGRQPTYINVNSAHVRGFTKHGVRSFLNNIFPKGFYPIAFNGSNFYPFPPLISILLSKIVPSFSAGIFFLYRKEKEYKGEFINATNGLATPYFFGDNDI